MRSDQGLVGQLTPSGMEILNASAADRPGLPYGCVVTQARPPGLKSLWGAASSPYAQATHALFVALYRFCSRTPEGVVAAPRPRTTSAGCAGPTGASRRRPPTTASSPP